MARNGFWEDLHILSDLYHKKRNLGIIYLKRVGPMPVGRDGTVSMLRSTGIKLEYFVQRIQNIVESFAR